MAVDVQHGQRLGLDVAHRHAFGAEHPWQGEVDLAQEADAAALAGAVPESSQEGGIPPAQLGPVEQARHVVALGLLDIEADLVDALGKIELEQLFRLVEAGVRQDRNHMERHIVLAQAADAGDRLVECALAAAALAMKVMQFARPVEAHADTDVPVPEQRAPVGIDQRAVGLEGMPDMDGRRPHPFDRREGLAIERDGHDQRFAGMPDHRDLGTGPARREDLLEQPRHRRLGDDVLVRAVGQITVGAGDVAEGRRLHDHHADFGRGGHGHQLCQPLCQPPLPQPPLRQPPLRQPPLPHQARRCSGSTATKGCPSVR